MTQRSPFRYFKTSPEIIRLAVMMYIRFPLSLRNVEDLLHERGIDICHETVRFWWNRFGPMFAAEIRKRRVEGLRSSQLALAPGRGVREDQRRTALPLAGRRSRRRSARKLRDEDPGQEGCVEIPQEIPEAARSRRRDRDRPAARPTERHCASSASAIGSRHGRWANNRAENSHQPFRRRERAMLRFRRMRSLQKFASVHASVHNHFNQERSLYSRTNFKSNRAAALAEWRGLCAE